MKLLILFAFLQLHFTTYNPKFEGEYYGNWGSKEHTYIFYAQGSYRYFSKGVFSNSWSKGRYDRCGDTLILNSWPQDSFNHETYIEMVEVMFFMDGDSCLISPADGYDYCKSYKKCKDATNPSSNCHILDSRQRLN